MLVAMLHLKFEYMLTLHVVIEGRIMFKKVSIAQVSHKVKVSSCAHFSAAMMLQV